MNRAVFIPEWTVINRTHDAQDSLTFSEPMYFGTARACIGFLNRHSFPQLVPWSDLRDPLQARGAVEKALEIAGNPSTYLYCLGPQPGLMMRLLEWAFADGDDPVRRELQPVIIQRVRQLALEDGDDDWHWMWRGLAAGSARPSPRFRYTEVEAAELGRHEYRARQQGRQGPWQVLSGSRAEPLREYLARFEGLELPCDPPEGYRSARIALLAGEPGVAVDAAAMLVDRGYRPLVIADFQEAYAWRGAVPMVSRPILDRDTLPWLGPVELVVIFPDQLGSPWIEAFSVLSLDPVEAEKPTAVCNAVLQRLNGAAGPDRRRTVALFQMTAWGGGAETAALHVLRHLDRRRYEPLILTWADARHHKERVPDIPILWVRAFAGDAPAYPTMAFAETEAQIRHSKFISSLDEHWRIAEGLREVLAQLGPDTILIASMEQAIVAAWLAQAGQRVPYIAWVHTMESAYIPQLYEWDPPRIPIQCWAFGSACAASEKLVGAVDAMTNDTVAHFGINPDRAVVIPYPQSCARIRRLSWSDDPEARQLRDQYPVLFAHVARFSPEKNHHLLLDAVEILASRRNDFAVLCIGQGHIRDEIAAEISRRGLDSRVLLLGVRSNPYPLMAIADALVLPSRLEGAPLVLAEAMVCGTTPIATDCFGGSRDVVRDCGLMVPPDDAVGLADAMERVADDTELRSRFATAGFARVEELDVNRVAAQWEEVIERYLPTRV